MEIRMLSELKALWVSSKAQRHIFVKNVAINMYCFEQREWPPAY